MPKEDHIPFIPGNNSAYLALNDLFERFLNRKLARVSKQTILVLLSIVPQGLTIRAKKIRVHY